MRGLGDDEEAPLFPQDQIESVLDTYTTILWKKVLGMVKTAVSHDAGVCVYDKDEAKVKSLFCFVLFVIKFDILIF